ncbi:hypothetical protein ACGFS9_03115 [Streptomyces sp. NPDC048566]|uniref:hypothetical protein n=1 Tax=Streptomyces sp. NPDC048566 TaxID=3365569 RepID=UPI0037226669
MAVLDELLVRLGVDMSEAEDEVDRGSAGITDRLGGLSKAGGLAAAGLGAAFVMGLESAMDISEVTNQLQNQLNLTDDEAARAGTVAGDVFSAGFGGSLDEVGEALDGVASSMHKFGSISDGEMEQLTKDALALAKTFEFDVAESTNAAGALIKSGLAKDGSEAMDLLAASAQKLPKAMREELPVLTTEYADFFDQLGFTGPQMFGLLTEAAKNPLFEIDKLADAVKEFTLQMANTSAVEGPLKDLGLDVAHIQKLINTGKGTKAFDEVNEALLKVEDQTKRTALQGALFGGPGEDLGNTLQAVAQAGGAAGAGMDDAAGAAQKITENMQNSPAQQWDQVMNGLSITLGQMLLPVLTLVSDLFKEHSGLMQIAIPIVLALAVGLAIAAAAQWAMNAAWLAWPGTWIIAAILAVIAIIVLLWRKNETFRAVVMAVWAAVRGGVESAVKGVLAAVGWLAAIPGRVAGWFGDAKEWAVRKALELVLWLAGLPGRVGRAVGGMFDGIPRAFRGAINSVIGWWNRLHFTIGGGSIMGVSIPSVTLNTPDIPYLADGGITTGPTLAMIGEGREDEVVLPLSRLDQMLNTTSRMTGSVQPVETRVTLAFEGADDAFVTFLQEITRTKGGGSVTQLAGEA